MTDVYHRTKRRYPIHHLFRGKKAMKLNPPKKNTFWAALIITAAGWLVYAVHLLAQFIIHVQILHLQMIAFVLVSIAFVLLCLGLTIKGL